MRKASVLSAAATVGPTSRSSRYPTYTILFDDSSKSTVPLCGERPRKNIKWNHISERIGYFLFPACRAARGEMMCGPLPTGRSEAFSGSLSKPSRMHPVPAKTGRTREKGLQSGRHEGSMNPKERGVRCERKTPTVRTIADSFGSRVGITAFLNNFTDDKTPDG